MPEDRRKLADELRDLLPFQIQEYAVILLDAEGIIVAWLSGAQRIFGYAAKGR